MCGIIGWVSGQGAPYKADLYTQMAEFAELRGTDSSGYVSANIGEVASVVRSDMPLTQLLALAPLEAPSFFSAHSRLVTNGMNDNQPVLYGDVAVLHNGILLDVEDTWSRLGIERTMEIDSELLAAIANSRLEAHGSLKGLSKDFKDLLIGAISCVVYAPTIGEVLLYSNTGSLYVAQSANGTILFGSEKSWLSRLGFESSRSLRREEQLLSAPKASGFLVSERKSSRPTLLPKFDYQSSEKSLLVQPSTRSLKRCTKCILPVSMPFIKFDASGICNFCSSYVTRLDNVPFEAFLDLADRFRSDDGPEVIVPFSGGRDSSFALHLVTKLAGLKPIAYTYDWGMVTDLGRRNISLMTSALGVEHIVIAADIGKKRRYIRQNLTAWLKRPHLGMISLLTAGDKHFYKWVRKVKEDTGVKADLWGINPLETTHFKAGFLGIRPDFESRNVFRSGVLSQISYQSRRFGQFMANPAYFNSSVVDTLSGEYWRSLAPREDYYHLFDYWRWDESEINQLLTEEYGWETASDSKSTWRIGDGTAGFYNYVYRTVAGFSEHDTFRSNQIREGVITRDEAMTLVEEENQPRYENIKWYLSAVGLDFEPVIKTVNGIKRLY